MASQAGAASRRVQAAGSTRRGQTGVLGIASGTQPCAHRTEGLLCLMLQPHTLLGPGNCDCGVAPLAQGALVSFDRVPVAH